MQTQPDNAPAKRSRARWLLAGALVASALAFFLVRGWLFPSPDLSRVRAESIELAGGRHLTVWWDTMPERVDEDAVPSGPGSNIHPADYTGPQACARCHERNYNAWSTHPHRWMNALADDKTVRGDFSGKASISYMDGKATFTRQGDRFLMRLERGDARREYRVTQTIGSRFFQYYIGRLIEGPEPKGHHFYEKDHVLPFGYWLALKEWVPIIHVGPEMPDGERPDPFAPPDSGRHYAEYAASCNHCHTTFALGDLFGRRPEQMGEHAPLPLHWSMRGYLEQAHPDTLRQTEPLVGRLKKHTARNPMYDWDAPRHAVTLGVSCEACHLGAKAHVDSKGDTLPWFAPASPHLAIEAPEGKLERGRTHDNVNWACGRCHTGARPQFAAGMSTWNSVEYADAMRGSCYSKLRCVDCHEPHTALGPRWSRPPEKDDAVCLECHRQYRVPEKRQAHTHHQPGSDGDRCLNCHMPRINEGLQDVVRTHMIYSPTRADMLEANHPNACNLCHGDRPIDWTLRQLKEWYGKAPDEAKIAANYPRRSGPVATGWLKSPEPAVRIVAVEALARSGEHRWLPDIIDALDDPYLANRQFAYKGLQEMLNVRLGDHGYHFWMTGDERHKAVARLRATLR